MKFLILTDHSGHSSHNSVYAIARELGGHPEIKALRIASRGDIRNRDFFLGKSGSSLYGVDFNDEFTYPAGDFLQKKSYPISLDAHDFILLRLPRPIPESFFPGLVSQFPENRIINRPSGIIQSSNKKYLLSLDRFTVPMELCRNIEDIRRFRNRFECVLKPLEEYGGKGIIRILADKVWREGKEESFAEFEKWYQMNQQDYLGMKFLQNVSQGDKRIVVAGGKVLTSSLRLPAADNWLCNVAQGGSDQMAVPDQREMEIVEYLSPKLLQIGVFYYGLDTLVNDEGERIISEVNTLSIGGIGPGELNSGQPLTRIFVDQLIRYARHQL